MASDFQQMPTRILRIACIIFISASFANAQTPLCGYGYFSEKLNAIDTLLKIRADSIESVIRKNADKLNTPRAETLIPVVVHIVWKNPEDSISDGQVFSQMDVLNRLFDPLVPNSSNVPEEFRHLAANTGIRFCIAQELTSNGVAHGIIRQKTTLDDIGLSEELYHSDMGGSDAWDEHRFLNIWVASLGKSLTGFGTKPGQAPPGRDGVVIHPAFFGINNSKSYNQGKIAVHEIGHYLGLSHTWAGCGDDDGIEDTPYQKRYYTGCPAYPQFSCGTSDMFMNYMDYTDDNCMWLFTKGQKALMRAALLSFRQGLLEYSRACYEMPLEGGNSELRLYPNPAKDALVVSIAKIGPGNLTGYIYDTLGRISRQISLGFEKETVVDLTGMASGIYFLKILDQSLKFSIVR